LDRKLFTTVPFTAFRMVPTSSTGSQSWFSVSYKEYNYSPKRF
jgi:hypothetical protein